MTILITGASSGFGEASARRFAAAGHSLILLARSRDKLEVLAASLQVPTHVVAMDVRDTAALAGLLPSLPEAFQHIDVLLNNAGLALGTAPAQRAELADWDTMVQTNVIGLMHLTHHVLPGMVARNQGHIINIGSTAASWPYPGGNAYGASKAFVQQFSRGLKTDVVGTRIRVSNIEPGMAETNFSNARFKGDTEAAAKVYAGTQSLSAEDVAEIIFWTHALPAHINITQLEVMPVCQAWGGWAVARD